MKRYILNHLKNIPGWRNNRKLVVISVDDYGNVRLDSKKARDQLDKAGLKVHSRFDAYDTLETREDLEALYDVLTSVKGKNGKHAVFTPFALPCNINFERMAKDGYQDYHYECLPETFKKMSTRYPQAYDGTWSLWQEGMDKGLMAPQFHGREHLNLKVFREKLLKNDPLLIQALKNRSYPSLGYSGYKTISQMAAFEFWDFKENEVFKEIIEDGLNRFEEVFGYRSLHFNPPGGREHPVIHKALQGGGVRYLDTPFIKNEHQGNGKYKRVLNYTGKKNHLNQTYLVRNVVFEPTHDRGIDWVSYTMKQIEAAFFWNRPAIISSHRVNFCGHIDPKNRKQGLTALKQLLSKIKTKWPDVEFMAANELAHLVTLRQ